MLCCWSVSLLTKTTDVMMLISFTFGSCFSCFWAISGELSRRSYVGRTGGFRPKREPKETQKGPKKVPKQPKTTTVPIKCMNLWFLRLAFFSLDPKRTSKKLVSFSPVFALKSLSDFIKISVQVLKRKLFNLPTSAYVWSQGFFKIFGGF